MGTMKYTPINAKRVKEQARGQWERILPAMGISGDYLRRGKQCPCPMCGGTDRYKFDGGLVGKDGNTLSRYPDNVYYCRHCGSGDGIRLIEKLTDMGFKDTVRAIDRFLNGDTSTISSNATYAPTAAPKQAEPTNYSESINALNLIREFTSRTPSRKGAEYLVSRGLSVFANRRLDNVQYGTCRYYVAGKGCISTSGKPLSFPAMIGFMGYWNESGSGISATQIYLEPEKIKPLALALASDDDYEFKHKKLFARTCDEGLKGRAVWFSNKKGYTVHVGEGIETMMAVAMHKRTLSVAACGTSNNLANFVAPAHTRKLVIWADLDRNGAGECAAIELKERYANKCDVTILLPELEIPEDKSGVDWLDVVCESGI